MQTEYSDINCGCIFGGNLAPNAKEIKAKINKWDPIKPKGFCMQRKPLTK